MRLPVVYYGHPVLRQKGRPIREITEEIQKLIEDMFETMEDAQGIGLAAQQVNHALQLTVMDLRGVTDRPSALFIQDQEVPVDEHMPMVLINPVITPLGDVELGPEGCLSFPEIYGEVSRPGEIEVQALDRHGKPLHFRCSGLLARCIQHETDHLNGILFIDRMPTDVRARLKRDLDLLVSETKRSLKKPKPWKAPF